MDAHDERRVDVHAPDGRPPLTGAVAWALDATVNRADVPALCDRLVELLRDSRAAVVICDVGAITAPDAGTIDALARLQLTARRLGCGLLLHRPHRRLRDLVAFAGLDDVLPLTAGLAVEPGRQAEQREEAVGVEERVDPPDPAG
jgi:hypothetical protein